MFKLELDWMRIPYSIKIFQNMRRNDEQKGFDFHFKVYTY